MLPVFGATGVLDDAAGETTAVLPGAAVMVLLPDVFTGGAGNTGLIGLSLTCTSQAAVTSRHFIITSQSLG